MNCFVCNQVITPKAGGTLVDGVSSSHYVRVKDEDTPRLELVKSETDYPLCSLHWVMTAHYILDMAKHQLLGTRALITERREKEPDWLSDARWGEPTW